MYHFEYVSKKEAAPYKSQLIDLLNRVQDYMLVLLNHLSARASYI